MALCCTRSKWEITLKTPQMPLLKPAAPLKQNLKILINNFLPLFFPYKNPQSLGILKFQKYSILELVRTHFATVGGGAARMTISSFSLAGFGLLKF